MTFVVTDKCIKCKYMDCVEVCPVDCFYEGANMLVIDPDVCIDCGVCVPECPADAIVADTDPAVRRLSRTEQPLRQALAQHRFQKAAAARRQGMGRRAGQIPRTLQRRTGRGLRCVPPLPCAKKDRPHPHP